MSVQTPPPTSPQEPIRRVPAKPTESTQQSQEGTTASSVAGEVLMSQSTQTSSTQTSTTEIHNVTDLTDEDDADAQTIVDFVQSERLQTQSPTGRGSTLTPTSPKEQEDDLRKFPLLAAHLQRREEETKQSEAVKPLTQKNITIGSSGSISIIQKIILLDPHSRMIRELKQRHSSVTLKSQMGIKSTTREMGRIQRKAEKGVPYPLERLSEGKTLNSVAKLTLASFLPQNLVGSVIEQSLAWDIPALNRSDIYYTQREVINLINGQIRLLQPWLQPNVAEPKVVRVNQLLEEFGQNLDILFKGLRLISVVEFRLQFKKLHIKLLDDIDTIYQALVNEQHGSAETIDAVYNAISGLGSATHQRADIASAVNDSINPLFKKEDVLHELRLFLNVVSEGNNPKLIRALQEMFKELSRIPDTYLDERWINKYYLIPLKAQLGEEGGKVQVKNFHGTGTGTTTVTFSHLLNSINALKRYISTLEILSYSPPEQENFLTSLIETVVTDATKFILKDPLERQLQLSSSPGKELPKLQSMKNVDEYYDKVEVVNKLNNELTRLKNINGDQNEQKKIETVLRFLGSYTGSFISKIAIEERFDTLKTEPESKEGSELSKRLIRGFTPYVKASEVLAAAPPRHKVVIEAIVNNFQISELYPKTFAVKVGIENESELLLSTLLSSLGPMSEFIAPKFSVTLRETSLESHLPNIASAFIRGASSVDLDAWGKYQDARQDISRFHFFKDLIGKPQELRECIKNTENKIAELEGQIKGIVEQRNQLKVQRDNAPNQAEKDRLIEEIKQIGIRKNRLNSELGYLKRVLSNLKKGVNPIDIRAAQKDYNEAAVVLKDARSQNSLLYLGLFDLLFGSQDSHRAQFIKTANGNCYNIDCSRYLDRYPDFLGKEVFVTLRSFMLDHPFSMESIPDPILDYILSLSGKNILGEWMEAERIAEESFFQEINNLVNQYMNYGTELKTQMANSDISKFLETFSQDFDFIKAELLSDLNQRLNSLRSDPAPTARVNQEINKSAQQIENIKKAKNFKEIGKLINHNYLGDVILMFLQRKIDAGEVQLKSRITKTSANQFAERLNKLQEYIKNNRKGGINLYGITKVLYPEVFEFALIMERIYGNAFENVACKDGNKYISLETALQIIEGSPQFSTEEERKRLKMLIEQLHKEKTPQQAVPQPQIPQSKDSNLTWI